MPTGPIVPDTSAWVEFLRATESETDLRLDALQRSGADLVVAGPVLMEVLAGARTQEQRQRIRDLFARHRYARLEEPSDFLSAASIYNACRAAGQTLRGHADCLIAAIAMRTGASVLHADADFTTIAEHAPLELA